MGLLEPAAPISATWQDHKDREPPSSEPGTDYATPYGTPVGAPGDGVVTYVKHDNSGARGRVVQIWLNEGRETGALHFAAVYAWEGQRVARGDIVAISGASGYGSDWYYGPHVHDTLWDGPAWSGPTIDFDLYAGNPQPPDMEDDMANVITVSVPVDSAGNQAYWSMNLGDNTIAAIRNGTQLDFRRNIGIPEYTNQSPAVLEGFRVISDD